MLPCRLKNLSAFRLVLSLFIFLKFTAPILGAQRAGPDACTAVGKVQNSVTAEPVRKAIVRLLGPQSDSLIAEAQTNIEGVFVIKEFPCGRYRIGVERNGFISQTYKPGESPYVSEFIDFRPQIPVDPITIKLVPAGVIAGRVVDEDGDPLAGFYVTPLVKTRGRGVARVTSEEAVVSNDLGEFRFHGLRPGRFFLRVDPGDRSNSWVTWTENLELKGNPNKLPREGFVSTYHPDALTFSQAQALEVEPGSTSSVQMVMRKVKLFSIRGKVVAPIGIAGENVRVSWGPADSEDSDGSYGSGGHAVMDKKGSFLLLGIPNGTHEIHAAANAGGGAWLRSVQKVEVNSADVSDVVVVISAGMDVEGQARFERIPASRISDGRVALLPVPESDSSRRLETRMNYDGTFTLRGIQPGRYRLRVLMWPRGYLKEARLGTEDIRGKTVLFESGLTYGRLEITVGLSDGTIRGRAVDALGNPVAGVRIWDAGNEHSWWPRIAYFAVTDQTGSFERIDCAPGVYDLAALGISADALYDAREEVEESLKGKWTRVQVTEAGTATIVLKIIPASEILKVKAK